MAKVHSVTPWQMNDAPGWYATFYEASGKRVTRGLQTRDRPEADLICRGLTILARTRLASPEKAPESMPPRALELWFGTEKVRTARVSSGLIGVLPPGDVDQNELGLLPPDVLARLEALELRNLQLECDASRERARADAAQRELEALRASVLGRATAAAETCPPMAEAIEQYCVHLRASATAAHAADMERVSRRFVKSLPPTVKTPVEVTPEHISRWLDERSGTGVTAPGRRQRNRVRVGRFLNWAASAWGFASPMLLVRAPSADQVARAKREIQWHEIDAVEAALDALPDDYWKALVGTLAFAGLRLAELAWLRRSDLQERTDGRRELWVASNEDALGGRHALKTDHSRRAVEVHPTRLWPLLERHLKATQGAWLFPPPKHVTRRVRKQGDPTRWRVETLSRRLVGDARRGGLLPEGMTARSLRRTFGSLMLRNNRSVAEVAAAMGNTPDVVQKHYARILGAEVSVRF